MRANQLIRARFFGTKAHGEALSIVVFHLIGHMLNDECKQLCGSKLHVALASLVDLGTCGSNL